MKYINALGQETDEEGFPIFPSGNRDYVCYFLWRIFPLLLIILVYTLMLL